MNNKKQKPVFSLNIGDFTQFADKLNKEAPGTRAAQEAQKLISKS